MNIFARIPSVGNNNPIAILKMRMGLNHETFSSTLYHPLKTGGTATVPTMSDPPGTTTYIVGTGVVWMWGGAPCGRPSSSHVEVVAGSLWASVVLPMWRRGMLVGVRRPLHGGGTLADVRRPYHMPIHINLIIITESDTSFSIF